MIFFLIKKEDYDLQVARKGKQQVSYLFVGPVQGPKLRVAAVSGQLSRHRKRHRKFFSNLWGSGPQRKGNRNLVRSRPLGRVPASS